MTVVLRYVRLGYRTPMSGEVVAIRLLSIPLLCWLGSVFGRIAASVVWGERSTGVGSRVVSDDTYFQLQDEVRWWGGVAGLCSAVAINCLPQLWPFVAFPATYVFSVFAGVAGGHAGWKLGLLGYFGVHATVAIGCIALATWELRGIFRFSLRTLLIVTGAGCGGAGIIVWSS